MPRKSLNMAARWTGFGLALLATLLIAVLTNREGYKKREHREVAGYVKWEERVVEIAKRIPVQEGGRVKPFETRAGFLMLKFHGARKMKIASSSGERIKIEPTEWLLDILFRPEIAKEMPTFRVDDSDLLEAVGYDVKKRRDRYSYNDLDPYFQKLGKLAGDLQQQEAEEKKKNPDYKFPRDKMDPRPLASMIMEYQGMLGALDFAHEGLTLDDSAEIVDPEQMKKVSYWVKLLPALGDILRQQGLTDDGQIPPHIQSLLSEMNFLLRRGERGIEWLPPYEATTTLIPGGKAQIHSGNLPKTFQIECVEGEIEVYEGRSNLGTLRAGEKADHPGADLIVRNSTGNTALIKVLGKEWMSAGARLTEVTNGLDPLHWELFSSDLSTLEDLVGSVGGKQSEFADRLEAWKDTLMVRAGELGVGEKIESEVTYYRRNYFLNGLFYFILAFVVAAVSWLAPASRWGKWTYRLTWILGICGAFNLVWGIVHRCILMERPPVGNLYDTLPFIAGGGVLVLFLLEAVTRRRIALGAAIAIGLLGLFLARAFEGVDAKDHMDPLRAVLRSNFWLSTHVIIITLGYSGGLIAAAMSHVYLYARAFGLDKADKSLSRFLTRSVYGLICFTLFFSLVGTVLGGIWANDSWGRFWGWDPKENGALLIVLWCLIILHARLGGYMREWGLHIASILGAIVVAFSWWGVNLLGTGLHSYGFTDGIGGVVGMFYLFEFVIALGGVLLALLDKYGRRGLHTGREDGVKPQPVQSYQGKKEALEGAD